MNESETRAEQIDPALAAAGWGVVEGSKILREYPITPGRIEGHGRRGKALVADYVLVYRNRKLGVLEAKAWDELLTEGVAQAKNYAGKLAIQFAYASNGQGIYGIDMETGREAQLSRYPTPEELWNLTFAEANAWRDRFTEVPFEDKGGSHPSRYYQDIAVERVMEAIAAGLMRILLPLATGTGKTFIAFQVAWKLFYSRWNLSREPSRRQRARLYQHPFQRQTASLSRVRPFPLRGRRRRGTRPAQIDAIAPPEIPRLDYRRRGRSGQARRHWQSLRRLPAVSVSKDSLSHTIATKGYPYPHPSLQGHRASALRKTGK